MTYYKPSIDLVKVTHLANLGLGYQEIAGCIGMSAKTFSRRRAEDESIDQAILEGRSHGIAEVAITLKKRACDGDIAAAKIYLNSLASNYGKTQRLEVSSAPNLIINLSQEPPALAVGKPN